MSQEINAEFIQARVNLVQIIATHVTLSKSRFVLKGSCPFHPDDMNSFMVSPAKNIFKCFGCGQEGGPIEFIMAIENKNHEEVVKILGALI